MVDLNNLPPRLLGYANIVYSACEALGNFFGFQDSSVKNQAEHILILLSNNQRYMNGRVLSPAAQPLSPAHVVHAKVFSNYKKWCRHLMVPPQFSRISGVAGKTTDLVLFFCVWGEASNIRHMPECLCFLFHKMMEEYNRSIASSSSLVIPQPRRLCAGNFLEFVVTPIYHIVRTVSGENM